MQKGQACNFSSRRLSVCRNEASEMLSEASLTKHLGSLPAKWEEIMPMLPVKVKWTVGQAILRCCNADMVGIPGGEGIVPNELGADTRA